MKKISPKLQEKLESFGLKVPEDLFIFRTDRDFYRKLTDEEMGELYHWSRAKNHAARINRANKHGNIQDPDIRRGKIYLADLEPVVGRNGNPERQRKPKKQYRNRGGSHETE